MLFNKSLREEILRLTEEKNSLQESNKRKQSDIAKLKRIVSRQDKELKKLRYILKVEKSLG